MRITVLAGGVGGARFALGLRDAVPDARLDIVANVGDDLWLAGVKVCPDLDSLLYALAGVGDTARGWGRAGESERVSGELAAYGVGWPWFTLGDLDLGTHLARTALLREGLSLTDATARLAARWPIGATLLPASDDELPTHVVTDEGTMHFEEWWVRTRASVPARRFVQHGVERARLTQAAHEAIAGADVVLVAPSNPVVSIGTILGIPGARGARGDGRARRRRVADHRRPRRARHGRAVPRRDRPRADGAGGGPAPRRPPRRRAARRLARGRGGRGCGARARARRHPVGRGGTLAARRRAGGAGGPRPRAAPPSRRRSAGAGRRPRGR